MAYYGAMEPESVRAQIQSTRGETIDLSIPIGCTVGDLCGFLVDEYGYEANTHLVYNGRVAPEGSLVNDYPYGSLVITSSTAPSSDFLPLRTGGNSTSSRAAPGESAQLPPRSSHPWTSRSVGGGMPPAPPSNAAPPPPPQQPHQYPLPPPPQQPCLPQERPPCAMQGPGTPPAAGKRATSPQMPSPPAAGRRPVAAAPPAPAPPPPPPNQRERSRDGSGLSARAPPTPSAKARRASPDGAVEGGSSGSRPEPGMSRSHGSNNDMTASGNSGGRRNSRSTSRAEATPGATAAGSEEVSEEKAPWQLATFTVDCIVPALSKTVSLQVNGDASVADLVLAVVAALPEVAGGSKVVYRGKVLPQTPESKLFNYGIRTDTRVYIASGRYANADTITLLEIENETNIIAEEIEKPLTDLERKGHYENLMRILFRTDGLMELEGEWRQRRKDAVAHIKRLQDTLYPEHD